MSLSTAPSSSDSLEDGQPLLEEDAGPLRRPGCQRPTLLVEDEEGLRYDPYCQVVLFALSDNTWNGRWILDVHSAGRLLTHIDKYSGKRNYYITKDDILNWIRQEEHHQHVLDMPSAVHGILTEEVVERTFQSFDRDLDGKLDREEWMGFLRALKQHHLIFLTQKSFQQFRAFYGRGTSTSNDSSRPLEEMMTKVMMLIPDSKIQNRSLDLMLQDSRKDHEMSHLMQVSSKAEELPRRFQISRDEDCQGTWSIIPPGWLADLYYYSANNHPLHGIIACDPTNLLTRRERFAMELTTILYLITTQRIGKRWVYNEEAPVELLEDETVFGLVVVTIPGMLIFQALLYLFTCPVLGVVNGAFAGEAAVSRARRWTNIGEYTAYFLIIVGFATAAVSFRHCAVMHCDLMSDLEEVLVGRLRSYVINWAMMVGVYFNLFIAWGNPDPSDEQVCLGDYIGLGQWRIEKQRFQAQCSNSLATLVDKKRSASPSCGCSLQ